MSGQKCRFTFLFAGILTYLPNWDAVLFFCIRVVPILRRVGPGEFRVLIVAHVSGDLDLDRLTAIEEVRVVANPLDLSPYYAQSDAVIVPIRGGGGTRIKILEAFSYGLPVTCSPTFIIGNQSLWKRRASMGAGSGLGFRCSPSAPVPARPLLQRGVW